MGTQEQIGVRVAVYRRGLPTLHFGLPQDGYQGGSVPHGNYASDLVSLAWGRSLSGGQAGRMVFVLPDRTNGEVGEEWSELIRPNDWVELEIYVFRTPFSEKDSDRDRDSVGANHGYECRFAGFVHEIQEEQAISALGTTVVVHDGLGILEQEHFGYWRNVGKVFQGLGSETTPDVVQRLTNAGYGGDTSLLDAGSICGVTEVIFRGLLYNRLPVRWKINKENYRWEDLHGYRFESDDFGISASADIIAPDGASWMDAVSWVVDAPQFYEFFMENLAVGNAGVQLRNGGQNDLGVTSQVRTRVSKRVLPGGRAETFVLRPVPFPTYDPQRGGYRSAAWDGLRVIEALPFGTFNRQASRSRQDIYSLYAVDAVNTGPFGVSSADLADANAQVVGDEQAYNTKVGYRPLDVKTKRTWSTYTYKGGKAVNGVSISAVELTRRLAWQVLSFNHWNDRFRTGQVSGPLDLRAELGVRYLHEGYLYYLEGYQHSLDTQGAGTQMTLTRGLKASEYGYSGGTYPQHTKGPSYRAPSTEAHKNWFPKYLGRQRPGDQFGVVAGTALQSTEDGAQPGEHGS